MIISRKRFEEEIAKAVAKAQDEMNEAQWHQSRFREIDMEIERMYRRIADLERKVSPELFPTK